MLFTNIQLDDFLPAVARFFERIEIEGAEECEWIMMAVINIGAVLEYGRAGGMLRKLGVVGAREGSASGATVRVVAKKSYATPTHLADYGDERRMDVDGEGFKDGPQVSPACLMPMHLPLLLKLAMQFAYSMLSFAPQADAEASHFLLVQL